MVSNDTARRSQDFRTLTESQIYTHKTSKIGISKTDLLCNVRVEDSMLRDEVTDGVGRSIHYASGQTVGELFAGMPKRFPGSPLVPALGKRNGHIAVSGGVVIGLG